MADTGKGEGRIKRQFDRIERRFPATKRFLDWLRSPRSMIFRVPISIILILGGIFSFLPILGIWMLPLGFLLLALDVAFLRTPIAAAILRTMRKWQNWRRERKRQKTWTS
jgi:hypothetical protein